ncbi:hypothetical protein LZ30DRAFT_786774 [Colletotrichum cereale]|nr:hypothetical protein LZ30DRAFT_786774 [Colletotrichum cereale]
MPPSTSTTAKAAPTRRRDHNGTTVPSSSLRVRQNIVHELTSNSDSDSDSDMSSDYTMTPSGGGRGLPPLRIPPSPGESAEPSRRRQTRSPLGPKTGRTSSNLIPPWATPPRPPEGAPTHNTFQGGPIRSSPTQDALAGRSSRRIGTSWRQRRPALYTMFVLLTAYQLVVWAAGIGSYVLQDKAERGCEACIYLGHVAREVEEHKLVLLIGMVYGRLAEAAF